MVRIKHRDNWIHRNWIELLLVIGAVAWGIVYGFWLCSQPVLEFRMWQPDTFAEASGVLTVLFSVAAVIWARRAYELQADSLANQIESSIQSASTETLRRLVECAVDRFKIEQEEKFVAQLTSGRYNQYALDTKSEEFITIRAINYAFKPISYWCSIQPDPKSPNSRSTFHSLQAALILGSLDSRQQMILHVLSKLPEHGEWGNFTAGKAITTYLNNHQQAEYEAVLAHNAGVWNTRFREPTESIGTADQPDT